MKLGKIESPSTVNKLWQVCYDSGELTEAVASITISNLLGNTDEEYQLICRFIDDDTTGGYYLRFNNDSGNNYGYQYIKGSSTTASALRDTSEAQIDLGYTNTDSNICFSKHLIYAKSGYIRTVLSESAEDISGTVVTNIKSLGQVWNNSADEITSMVIGALNDKINIGSRIILLKKVKLLTGIKTGKLNIQGNIEGAWEKIYDSGEILALSSATKLLIRGDSIGDATGKTVTANGNAAVTTTQKKFNEVGASIVFDGVGDYLSLADSDDWNFGNGDFTLDFWIRFNSVSGGQGFVGQYVDDNNFWVVGHNISGHFAVIFRFGGVDIYDGYIVSWAPTVDTWYHIAIERIGSNLYIFKNGVSQTLEIYNPMGTKDLGNYAAPLTTGRSIVWGAESWYLNGWLSMFRITKGTALWTSNFTPPVYNDYGGAITSLSITGLNGNTDVLYRLRIRAVSGAANNYYGLRYNNDSGSNYGYELLRGENTTLVAQRETWNQNWLYYAGNNELLFSEIILYAKSGYVRTSLSKITSAITGTTVNYIVQQGCSWNNSADNITSLVILAGQTNGLGIGTYICLERLNL